MVAAILVLAGALAAVLYALTLLALRARRRAIGMALLGPLDEIYNPAAHRSRIEQHAEAQTPARDATGER